MPTYLPTEPSLEVTDLKRTSSSKKRVNQLFIYDLMENHKVPENSITCYAFLEFPLISKTASSKSYNPYMLKKKPKLPKCFPYKGFSVMLVLKQIVRFLNELMREGGKDYGLIYPKIVQVGPNMHILQEERESKNIMSLIESNKDNLSQFLASDKIKITPNQKKQNFENTCAAYTIFSYIFGGFYRDSDYIFLYNSGHVVLTGFNHILGFKDPFCEELENSPKPPINVLTDEDLFCTSEIASLLNLDSQFREFTNLVWEGFSILRTNYVTVMQACSMMLADWHITNEQLDALYERLMVKKKDDLAKQSLFEKCKKANNKKMSSYDKLYL